MNDTDINKAIKAFKNHTLNASKAWLRTEGTLEPVLNFLISNEKGEIGQMVAPIMGDMGENAKDFVAGVMVPFLFGELAKGKYKPLCFSFSSEAWLRMAPIIAGSKTPPPNWKLIPKIEVLITTFETATTSEMVTHRMKRVGKVVNKEGKMVDQIELEELPLSSGVELTGRFMNLFAKHGWSAK